MAATLDSLPPEILLEVMSWLDWRSLQSLERVSVRCRDAVTLHLGRLRVCRITKTDMPDELPLCSVPDLELEALWELLPRLTGLRELHVYLWEIESLPKMQEALEAVLTASHCWPQLERLTIDWPGPMSDEKLQSAVLGHLCANCPRLTDVTLGTDVVESDVEAVLTAVPGLRALRVGGNCDERQGAWLAQLPVELRRLSVECLSLRSAALVQLSRCSELRSLQLLNCNDLRPDHVSAGLAGCVRLERLRLEVRSVEGSVGDCLPPTGLPALRHLDLSFCWLTDADLRRVLKQLPGLESVCLEDCRTTTSSCLALLVRLPALSSLSLVGTGGVSDWVLDRLSAAPLVELQLGGDRGGFESSFTPEGLLRLTQSCPTLRTVMVRGYGRLVEQVSCGPGVEERHLLRLLRAGMLKMAQLLQWRRSGQGGAL